jgi:hypothetical protein
MYGPLPSNGCFSASTVLSLSKYATICRTITLPVVLYGCETWSMTLMEEHILRVFEKRVPSRISGPEEG